MFSCLYQLWDWLDPSMENKKGVYQSTPVGNEIFHEALPKQPHQHNTAPQHLRLLQYGLKIPNHPHMQLNSPLHLHRHQPIPHRHLQPSPQIFQYGPNLYQANQPPPLHPHTQVAQSSPQIWVPHQPPVHYHQKSEKAAPMVSPAPPAPPAPPPKLKEVERKKSNQLRSPVAKRPLEAPVTMQGWLHKQGSEGLMLWKKRWFVLSEYCLFYYKGSEEEKLLGSILLPSYKVSICGNDDKVNRKFAFKCEHANMRTYILAADSQELMLQWIRVLNLACLLQNNIEPDQQSGPSVPSTYQSTENSDSGFHQQYHNTLHAHSSSNTTDMSNPSQQESVSQYQQPLYANAPPKPRRLNDAGYSSPSPDVLMRGLAKSPVSLYVPPEYAPRPKFDYYSRIPMPQNMERRTPDTYGRSKLPPAQTRPTDYEEVYAEHSMYKRPLSPVAYSHKKASPVVNPAYRTYTPVSMLGPKDILRKSPSTITRPHSADFLEYELNHRQQPTHVNRQQPRPKSSLDINRNTNDSDNYFYSEERYADKMRKSAQYLPNMPKYVQEPRRRVTQAENFVLMRSNTQPIQFNHLPIAEMRINPEPVRSRSVLSEGSLSKEIDVDLRASPRVPVSPSFGMMNYEDARRNYEQFTRSASARLAHNGPPLDQKFLNPEGDRKREESMKRLLEWKQRMLQSPLNRKAQNQRLYPGRAEYYYKPEGDYGPNPSLYTDGRRSVQLSQYNSYSSDDEENEERSKETAQAGRTLDTFPYTELLTHPVSSTMFSALVPAKPPNLYEDESTLTKPLIQFHKDSSNLAHVSSLRAEFVDKFAQSPTITEIKSNGALVKSILAEFEKHPEPFTEQNYMTMTPKLNILEPNYEQTVEPDESPYVEMAKNIDLSLLQTNQPYEIVCFGDGKFEPVYMELKNPETKLPDIIISPTQRSASSKSDCSDADDEASKDLDSLDTPSNRRFSLSDTFRPASYYLGASQSLPEQDSSDSELVSPPPIPTSSPIEEAGLEEGATPNRNSDQFFNSIEEKKRKFSLRSYKYRDSSSICSDSDMEVRRKDYERMLKRRPVSEDCGDELDSMDGNFNESVDLDKYLIELQSTLEVSNEGNLSRSFHEYENFYMTGYPNPQTPTRSQPETETENHEDYTHRAARPESSASTSAEICGLLQSSNRSTPSLRISSSLSVQEIPTISSYFSDRRDKSSNSSFSQPAAPYYYSDLSMNTSNTDSTSILTLNNQRGTMNGSKRDITHIVNPIKCNGHLRRNLIDSSFKLAAEARSASVDFLNLTDKSGHIDKKNIYESDTLKRLKVSESEKQRNLYPTRKSDKFDGSEISNETINVRRSHSLEGLLENVLSVEGESSMGETRPNTEGSYLWEEDSIWRERLRSASQRHTKSMDDLDCIGDRRSPKKSSRGISREVTYVNDNIYNMPLVNKLLKENEVGTGGTIRKEGSFIIDREKLRQWDLLSSAPSDDQLSTIGVSQAPRVGSTVLEIGDGSEPAESTNTQAASGSISINTRDTFPKAISAKRIWTPNSQIQARSVSNIPGSTESEYLSPQPYCPSQGPNYADYCPDTYKIRKDNWNISDKMHVSAGELLGRTHEELVLLLIQLRRQSANTLQAIENCYNEVDTIQAQLHGSLINQAKRLENLQKLEQIKQHLIDLEKQYEKGKPLVNLVDNMVKLGSLYRSPAERNASPHPHIRDRLEFNQQVQERRLLAEEKRDWNRLNPSHIQLQEKVQQLYQLDQLIQDESSTLQELQHNKEEIERALGGLRMRLHKGFTDPAEIEQARKQQATLENDLSRVHLMLAQNSKKLEETVAGNARLEQELLILKQKLQISRQQRSSPQFSNAGDSLPCAMGTSAMLESDLQRVQKKVGDLQKQREELSMQVRQLTDRSNHLSSTVQNSQSLLGNRRKVQSVWRETDLDNMSSIDHGDSWDPHDGRITPLYINTELKQSDSDYYNRSLKSSDSTSDDAQNFIQEKQEIKTVRIVKRESERRQRDREKVTTGKWDALFEEDTSSSQNSSVLFRPGPAVQKTQSTTNMASPGAETDKSSGFLSRQSSLSSPSLPSVDVDVDGCIGRSPELSPIFKSEAARQIITEMAIQEPSRQPNRRAVPKEKRRHYTAPHNNLTMKSLNRLATDEKIVVERRARDDLDMERALRQRIDAPDVVRSTLSNKELKYNESTIDNILGTPNKINIPERYIPEQLPQLSAEEQEHRLRKVESIKKMLSDAAIISASSSTTDEKQSESSSSSVVNKATTKMIEEKKQREHLLQLNQILAKQVMEMSKIVAVKALAKLPLQPQQMNTDEEDSSPVTPLPLYQQRDNFYS